MNAMPSQGMCKKPGKTEGSDERFVRTAAKAQLNQQIAANDEL